MKLRKSITFGYRDLKIFLNPYYKFKFSMPRRGRNFTPAQKSVITRAFNRYGKLITKVLSEKISFLRYPSGSRLPHIDGIRSNKGIFYHLAGASVKKIQERGRKKYIVVINFKSIRGELFIPFPPSVVSDPERINIYVQYLMKKYKPKSVRISVNGGRGSNKYDSRTLAFYTSQIAQYSDEAEMLKLKDSGAKALYTSIKDGVAGAPYFNGVFLEF